jgi:hypothetical protein
MLITEPYRALNAELHAQRTDYGNRSARHAETVHRLMEQQDCETALDYGCGKGHLLQAVPGMVGYDPAIPEQAGTPEPADLVVCTDVLEHIEPDCLEAVLADLNRCTKKVAYLVISTRPARKTLPDGRNAHLIVQSADWWLAQLADYFQVIEREDGEDEVRLVGEPLRYIRNFPVKSAVAQEIRCEQVRWSIRQPFGRLEVQPPHGRPMILCAYGPSLQDYWQHAVSMPGDLFTCSGAHDFLISKGFAPKGHAECDSRPHKAQFVSRPHQDTLYYLASCCHRDTFAQIPPEQVRLWHVHGNGYDHIIHEVEPHAFTVAGGSTIGLRALSIGWVLGYRTFHVFGMDCSFTADDQRHAGEHCGKPPKQIIDVRCNGKWFRSSGALIHAARNFITTLNEMTALRPGEFEYFFHGDGLLKNMLEEGLRQQQDKETKGCPLPLQT